MKKTSLTTWLLLLVIASATLLIEGAILQSLQLQNKTINNLTKQLTQSPVAFCLASPLTGEKVALRSVNLPLYAEAKRLTFDGGNWVRYRLSAENIEVAKFYAHVLTNQCWQPISLSQSKLIFSKNQNQLYIALDKNPLSSKLTVTYLYQPAQTIKVLGLKLAQDTTTPPPSDSSTTPPPSDSGTPPPPPSDQTQLTPPTGDQNTQPQPPMPTQPYQPPTSGQPGSTCRVNGVEMPGSCEKYNQGPIGSEGQQMMSQQGPSEEEIQKMDEQRFRDMKRGLSQFTKGVKSMKKSITRVKTAINKCGVNLPEELTSAMANVDNLIGKIESAKTADELDEMVGDIEDIGAVMQDWGPRMGDLHRLCQMIKQAGKDQKQLERSLKRAEARDKANKKLDLTEILANFKNDISNLGQVLAEVKELAKTDAESALEKLEDDFYGQMDNVRNNERAIDMVFNITQGIRDVNREIKNIEKQINNLKRKKIDISEAQELLAQLKSQVQELQVLIKGSFDPDDLIDQVEAAFDIREQLQDLMQQLGASPQMMPQIQGSKGYNVQINLPEAFKKQGPDEEENLQPTNPVPTTPVPTNPRGGNEPG